MATYLDTTTIHGNKCGHAICHDAQPKCTFLHILTSSFTFICHCPAVWTKTVYIRPALPPKKGEDTPFGLPIERRNQFPLEWLHPELRQIPYSDQAFETNKYRIRKEQLQSTRREPLLLMLIIELCIDITHGLAPMKTFSTAFSNSQLVKCPVFLGPLWLLPPLTSSPQSFVMALFQVKKARTLIHINTIPVFILQLSTIRGWRKSKTCLKHPAGSSVSMCYRDLQSSLPTSLQCLFSV